MHFYITLYIDKIMVKVKVISFSNLSRKPFQFSFYQGFSISSTHKIFNLQLVVLAVLKKIKIKIILASKLGEEGERCFEKSVKVPHLEVEIDKKLQGNI